MNDWFDLHIITPHHSEVYCGYLRRLVFVNSLTFSHIPPCFHAKPPDFPHLIGPRDIRVPACYVENICSGKRCPLIKGLATVEPHMCPSCTDASTM